MNLGKVSVKTLENSVFTNVKKTQQENEILVGASIGEDCAAISFCNELCVLSSDPITAVASAYQAGYIALYINCNDVFASGGRPIGIMLTILLPESSNEEVLSDTMKGATTAAKELGVEIIGGHTEVTDAVNRLVVSATVIGKADKGDFIYSSGAKVGQSIVMTKYAGIEGTSIIANDYTKLLREHLTDEEINKALSLSESLSVKKEAEIGKKYGATAMHDVTEGGVLGACWELAECSKVGARIILDDIPVLEETKLICESLNIDPYKLISSGALLITTYDGQLLVERLVNEGINAAIIGEITSLDEGIHYIKNGEEFMVNEPSRDEIYKL